MLFKNKQIDRERTLLDLYHDIARLARLIEEYLFLVKKQSQSQY